MIIILANQKVRIKLIQSNQSETVSYFHENLNKQIGAVAQTVYTDVYNCLRRRLGKEMVLKKNHISERGKKCSLNQNILVKTRTID